MKIPRIHPGRRNQSGMATMVFLVLLMIMMILVIAESRALLHLNREAKFLEKQQIKRLNGPPAGAITTTNTSK